MAAPSAESRHRVLHSPDRLRRTRPRCVLEQVGEPDIIFRLSGSSAGSRHLRARPRNTRNITDRGIGIGLRHLAFGYCRRRPAAPIHRGFPPRCRVSVHPAKARCRYPAPERDAMQRSPPPRGRFPERGAPPHSVTLYSLARPSLAGRASSRRLARGAVAAAISRFCSASGIRSQPLRVSRSSGR